MAGYDRVEKGKGEDESDLACIYRTLGSIESKQQAMLQAQDKMFYGLLGIIAAQIGIKLLGTDPFLYIATSIGALAVALALGLIINLLRRAGSIGHIGWAVIAFLVSFGLVQVGIFFRDAYNNSITDREVYVLRIILNLSLFVLIWFLWGHSSIFLKIIKKHNSED